MELIVNTRDEIMKAGVIAICGIILCLAIWFNKLPGKTVVWYADTPNNPTPKGSKLELTADRGLLLTGPRNQELWKSGTIVSQADMAIFNDTGNFVLFDRKSEKIWESFNHLTDTFLPTQHKYWKRELWCLQGYHLQTFLKEGSGSIADYYYRATLDFDGVFTTYSHPKNFTKESDWSVVWSIPDNICLQPFAYGNSGNFNRGTRFSNFNRTPSPYPTTRGGGRGYPSRATPTVTITPASITPVATSDIPTTTPNSSTSIHGNTVHQDLTNDNLQNLEFPGSSMNPSTFNELEKADEQDHL
ncbi:hypothetical protein G4B88_004691 [Cannabis sativa]|uniref:Bulb-type lectin domain-containing protein n=1 Tax=Cannabis sativa TaxID=3483 RepID=A0A7J6FYS9_CANSA|nr:hypothetical protein G4B88_004691 [Cannabis sativa]